jgi:hypothetical protein
MSDTKQHFSISELALAVGEKPWRLAYYITRGEIPGASVHLPGRRVFTAEDVNSIREALQRRAEEKAKKHRMPARD